MSTIRFRCFYCYRVHRLQESAVGRVGRCACGKTMVVPEGCRDPDVAPDQLPLATEASPGEEPPTPLPAGPAPAASRRAEPERWEDQEAAAALRPRNDWLAELEAEASAEPPAAVVEGDGLEERSYLLGTVSPPRASPLRTSGSSTRSRKGASLMARFLLVLGALAACLWLVHTSPWIYIADWEIEALRKPLPQVLGLVGDPGVRSNAVEYGTHYFGFERAFWSAILAGLALSLGIEGWLRRRRGR